MSPVACGGCGAAHVIAAPVAWHTHCTVGLRPSADRRLRVRPQIRRLVLVPLLLLTVVAVVPIAAEAQVRRGAPIRQRLILHGGVYRPVFFSPWYGYGYGYGYGYPWYPYRFGYPYQFGYYGRYDASSAVRLEVTPKNAEVYVDGYRAGVVDDFDGFFQRLRVQPGEHEIVLYLDGYRTVRQRLYLSSGGDQKIRYTMVPLPPGEQPEPRPEPPAISPEQGQDQPPAGRFGPRGRGPGPGVPGPGGPPRPQPGAPEPGPSGQFGALSVRIQPADADVLIDGERWTGPASQDRLIVQLSGGRHRIEVQKEGYEKYSSDVDVRSGETVTLNVSLLRR